MEIINSKWKRVGFYPTPNNLVDQFTSVVFDYLSVNGLYKKNLSLLDLFAGDGRLGKSVYLKLISQDHKISNLSYVEVEKDQIDLIDKRIGNPTIFHENVFTWAPKQKKFDLIVSNPPYLILNSLKAADLGFTWEYVKSFGRNLYTLGIVKGIELCKEGGMLAVISPFSWLRSEFSAKFRDEINSLCSSVFIKANDHRTVFKDVNQDIGFQIFIKRSKENIAPTGWKFGYNGYKPKTIIFDSLKQERENQNHKYKVMVGPVVWNRKKEYLTSKKSKNILVVYGGNIGHDGKLNFNIDRYKDKQYIHRTALLKTDIYSSPVILIRRIMRGIPGNWTIDSSLLKSKFIGTAENHVIVIVIPSNKLKSIEVLHKKIMNKIRSYYYLSGSPSISVKVVKQLVNDFDNFSLKKRKI